MLGDIISPSIATWSTTAQQQQYYTDLNAEVPVVHGGIDELNAPLLQNPYNTYNKVYSNVTSMLLDFNETSAYQIVLNGTSGNSSNSNNILLSFNDGGESGDGFITYNGTGIGVGLGGDGGVGSGVGILNGSNNIIDVFIGERNEFDDQQLEDIIGGNGNATADPMVALVKMIVMSIVLGLLIFITIIGNVFVIAAIILERNLQSVANYLVVSLALADLLVACLVMPLGAVYEISEGWILGPELCDIWTSCDVLCCTASILHLVAIAADRYWTVTNIDYSNVRTPSRVFCMIFCVWFTALIISLAPLLGWKDPEYMQRIEEQKCMVSQDVGYQIFATCCTFYVPLLVILALYWKIYKIARKRIQRRIQQRSLAMPANHNRKNSTTSLQQRKRKRLKICFGKAEQNAAAVAGANAAAGTGADVGGGGAGANMETNVGNSLSISNMREETEYSTSNFDSKSHATELTTASGEAEESQVSGLGEISTVSQEVASTAHQQQAIAITLTTSAQHLAVATACPNAVGSNSNTRGQDKQQGNNTTTNKLLASIPNPYHKLTKRRQMLEAKRERKAAQTLAIITGAFAICWLPFFVMALTLSLCKECHISSVLTSLFLWLGYFNSTLNPIIYTIFNPEFRRAFQRILCGRKRTLHSRSGKI
ncbi:5-hydroxytryptamine receptor 2B [Ceratitis capitata]|uniref:5-hydroxytryptamine receptor 2B n=1 Tax=Ceratitis capitata TaxID=7213 RepID=UPI000329BF3C|nr:5-hydroxytryptamine receptor 2B [Ceratitis capitata]